MQVQLCKCVLECLQAPLGHLKGELLTGVEFHFTLKRSEYGETYGLPGIGDDVDLTVAVGGVHK
jgi:hypothetical protein